MNPGKTWGVSRIWINGQLLETAPKPTFRPGGVERTEVEADNRAGMFNEKPLSSMLDCKPLITAGVSLGYFQSLSDETLTIEMDTGQTYVVRHAYAIEAVEANDGSATLKMMGPPAEELTT